MGLPAQQHPPEDDAFSFFYQLPDTTTLTIRFHDPKESPEKKLQRWIRRLNVTNQQKVQYVYVVEESSSGRAHVHFQLGPMNIRIEKMKQLWVSSGGGVVNDIQAYDDTEGSWYTVKEWSKSDHKGVDTRKMSGATT